MVVDGGSLIGISIGRTDRAFTEGCTDAKTSAINQAGQDFGKLADAAVR